MIAMIPARMGSKRIPKKNIRLLHGKPLIWYAIDNTLQSRCFDEIWVNSESDLLGELARKCGVGFHKRPEKLAADMATNQDFTTEFLRRRECDFVVMVNPTSPLLRPETIRTFCDFVARGECETVLSVLDEKAECFYHGKPVNFRTTEKINSQDLTPVRKVIWALTAWRRDHFLHVTAFGECGVFSGRLGLYTIPMLESLDIDTQEQWDLAEGMLFANSLSNERQGPITYWGETCED